MTSGASTAGSTLPTDAKVCCKNIAARASNIWDKPGGSEGRPLPPIIGPILVRGNTRGTVVAGEAIFAADTFAAGRPPAGYRTPSASKQIQPARIAAAERGQRPTGAAAGGASAGPHASRKRPQGALSEPGADRGDRRHGGRGSARPRRRADDACDPERIRIPSPMALRRLCDLGQPQRHPQGQPGLRHEQAPLPLSPDAKGGDAGLIEGAGNSSRERE